ncbi:MAG: protein translocase subunit SecF [Patescibacteria group bacterium]
MINVITTRRYWFLFSGALVAASIAAIVVFGLRLGIDFTGGTLVEVQFNESRPEKTRVEQILVESRVEKATVQFLGERGYLVRAAFIDEAQHAMLTGAFKQAFGDSWREERFETIGPTVSQELKRNTLYAIVLVILSIVVYIAWTFRRVSEPVNSWKYGVCAIIALLHDVVIPTGVFAVLGRFGAVEIDALFVTALLTIFGFSVNDTIVMFDRIRENLQKRRHDPFEQVVHDSINQTVTRSINTTMTTLLALVAVYFFGGATTKYFALALIIGFISGVYSSIFLASPLLVTWYHRQGK